MQAILHYAEEILRQHPAPAMELGELHRRLRQLWPAGTSCCDSLRRILTNSPDRFRVVDPWCGPWIHDSNRDSSDTEGVVVIGPDGTVWLRAGGDNAAYRGDVESCYAYARGQVDHDARIERDVASAFDSDAAGFGLTALRGRMNNFERGNRVPALFSSCMSAKGYNRR